MNPSDFIRKWRDVALSERSACHEHFLDLCALVGHPTPVEMDKTGEVFTFEKGVEKTGGGDGWADVWKRGFFGWEYKGPRANLFKAYEQLLRYREALENPPLLVVCDMNILEIHTNFTGTAPVVTTIPLEELDGPRNLEILRAVFHDPEKLKPGVTSEAITAKAARHIGDIAQRLRERGEDAQQVAHFLDRLVFCMFAEDIGLLQDNLFTRILDKAKNDPPRFCKTVTQLFDAMATGGDFGMDTVRRFNGSLFQAGPALLLGEAELKVLVEASRLDWSAVDPSIFGTLFERGLDPSKRAQLGAHYTSRQDIEALVEPVVMVPLRRAWEAAKAQAQDLMDRSEAKDETGRDKYTTPTIVKNRERAASVVADFLGYLGSVTVLDAASGSGNFLYVTLQKMKDLEKEVINWAADRGLQPPLPLVHPRQFFGIEVNPYAFDLAQMTLWIGYLQWIRANGLGSPSDPVLESLEGNFQNKDAILDLTDPAHPREPEWPKVDFIVGNPPFLGDKVMRRELGDTYVDQLRELFKGRIPGQSDLCCYWFEKARAQINSSKCQRAGLLATQGIRGGANREVLKRIKESGDIFFAESDRPWVLDGANVHVSMVGFDKGMEKERSLDGNPILVVSSNLSEKVDITQASRQNSNQGLSFIGISTHGPFDLSHDAAAKFLLIGGNPNQQPNSDMVRPYMNGLDITTRPEGRWVIAFPPTASFEDASLYEGPFQYLAVLVKPLRDSNHRAVYREKWWLHGEGRPASLRALKPLPRYIGTPRVSKHRLYVWVNPEIITSDAAVVFARSDDYFFGVLHSRIHEVWSRAQATQLREASSGTRYTPTTCFETFPFPWPPGQEPQDEPKVQAIAEAARDLDALRQAWLNPPEWTKEEILEFPGSVGGPWARFVTNPDARGIGTIRYPRLTPKDEASAALLKKRTLTALYNQRPTWLDLAHKKLDAAVATAYGWPPDLSDPDLLQRLLDLNHARHRA